MATDLKFNRNGLMVLAALGVVVMVFILYRVSTPSVPAVRISEVLSASIVLAERGGKRIVQIRDMSDEEIGKLSKGLTKEGSKEYVTMGDKESHEIIVSGLKSLWPNLPVQSEENDRKPVEVEPLPASLNQEIIDMLQRNGETAVPIDDVTVWIDPLDATQEYTEGGENKDLLRFVTVMVCIAVQGRPVAGVIHQPYHQDTVTKKNGVTKWAWVGHGVSEALIADSVPAPKDDKKIRVIYSRSHAGTVKEVAEKAFPDKTVENIVAAGSGHKVLQVVEKRADLYLHTTAIKKWDICAGNALLDATGGKMTTRKGREIDYSFEGNPKNEDGLVVALDEHFDDYLKHLMIKDD